MNRRKTQPINPVSLVENLDPEAIRTELDELAKREDALRVLLRAAVARKRGQVKTKEVSSAS
jgi:hypothetical protein